MPSFKWFRTRIFGWATFVLFLVGATAAWFTLDPGFEKADGQSIATDEVKLDEFDRRVREYILNNPEIIYEAAQRLQARQRAAELNEAKSTLQARAEEVFRDPESPVGGNPEGDVTIVEFFDYNCPYCRRVGPVMLQAEAADSNLRIVYKEFPILGSNSRFAAKAGLAAHKQEKYVAFHKALMQIDGTANESKILEVARAVGLDNDQLRKDMEHPAVQAAIDRNSELARALRITGTPGFVIGDQILRGASNLATIQKLIDRARKREQSQAGF